MYKLYISVLEVYILPLDTKVYKALRLWRHAYYSEKNGFAAVTQ